MKRAVHHILSGISTILAISVPLSCRRDVIYDEKSDCQIIISPVYDMLYDRPDRAPSLFRVLLYDPLSHNLVSSNTVSGSGGYLYNIHPGTFDILVYNYTLNRTKVTHEENLSLIQAGTSALAYRETPVVETPNHLFVQRFDNVEIPHLSVNDDPFVLRCDPVSAVDSWILVVDGIKGLRNADYIDIFISGQAQNSFIGRNKGERMNDVAVTVTFQAQCDYGKGLIYTPFTTFGKIADEKAKLELNIRIVGSGGEVYSCQADVTDQFDDPENIRHEIKATFDITINERRDGGMNPSADPWDPDVEVIGLE